MFSQEHALLQSGRLYIVALSGGADSVALLCAMKQLGVDVEAAHCNFKLRGDESERDEKFCIDLCERLNVPLHRIHFDTAGYAELHHVSIEMAARDLRYAYFENLRKDIGAEDICVAHHRDDSVETVLLNLVRGTGLRGLRGIMPRNGHIIRPLLNLSREDVLDYLLSIGQPYITDSSNLKDDVKRNKLRLNVIPMLRLLNPNVQQSIFDMTIRIGEVVKVFDAAIDDCVRHVIISKSDKYVEVSIPKLLAQPSAECVLFEILQEYGFTSPQIVQVNNLLSKYTTGTMFYSDDYELLFNRERILIGKKRESSDMSRVMKIPELGTYVYSNDIKIKFTNEYADATYKPSKEKFRACLDASVVKFPLVVRHIQKGDRFVPFGMKSTKLVSDYLTDRKRNLFEKYNQLVVSDATGRIVWLVGERTDNRFAVKSHTTSVLIIDMACDGSVP